MMGLSQEKNLRSLLQRALESTESDLFCGHREALKGLNRGTAWLEQCIQRRDLQACGRKDKFEQRWPFILL